VGGCGAWRSYFAAFDFAAPCARFGATQFDELFETFQVSLLNDFRVPFLFFASNLGSPMQPLIIELPDFLDPFHK